MTVQKVPSKAWRGSCGSDRAPQAIASVPLRKNPFSSFATDLLRALAALVMRLSLSVPENAKRELFPCEYFIDFRRASLSPCDGVKSRTVSTQISDVLCSIPAADFDRLRHSCLQIASGNRKCTHMWVACI